jgi:hypothetical protein
LSADDDSAAMMQTFSEAPLAKVRGVPMTVVGEPELVLKVTDDAVVVPELHDPLRLPEDAEPEFDDVELATTVQRRPEASPPVLYALAVYLKPTVPEFSTEMVTAMLSPGIMSVSESDDLV